VPLTVFVPTKFCWSTFFPLQDTTVPAVSGARQKGTWGAINILLVH